MEGRAVEKVTASGFAAILGVHKATICRAIQAGRLVPDADGRLDVALCLQRWESTRSGMRPDVAARIAAERAAKTAANPNSPGQAAAGAAGGAFSAAPVSAPSPTAENASGAPVGRPASQKSDRQHYSAVRLDAANKLALLEIELRTHQRYPLESIRREAHALGGTLRAGLERLIDQTAPLLAMTSDRAQRAAIIQPELLALRRLLRKSLPRALRSLRRASEVAR